MRKLRALLIVLVIGYISWAQQATQTPLGVLITPPPKIKVAEPLRSALPKKATVRLVQRTEMAVEGEQVVVYERGNKYEPDSHVAVVKGDERVSDFRLAKLFAREGIGSSYALFSAAEFKTAEDKNAFVAAFRNIGNGAGTLFVLLTERNGRYEVAWKQGTSQGRFKVLKNGNVQVWNAGEVPDGEIDCTWCKRHYKVSRFEWKGGSLFKVDHFTTRGAFDPASIANKPLVVQK